MSVTTSPRNGLKQVVAELRRRLQDEPDPSTALRVATLEYLCGDMDSARQAAESAFLAFKAAGQRREAAAAAGILGKIFYDGLGNRPVGHGWFARGERLLDGEGPCLERGWLELAVIGCNVPDAGMLEQRARAALSIAEQFNDAPLECKALADLGLALVSMGRIADGTSYMDQALTLVSTGEVADPWVVGQAGCALASACERATDLDRIDALVQVFGSGTADDEVLLYFSHCRAVYGTLLCHAGRWPDAEKALCLAVGAAEVGRNALQRARTRAALADLRVRQGRLEEARQLLRGLDDHVETADARARLHLAQREVDLAAAVLRQALRDLGADRLRAAPLLQLLSEAEQQRGDRVAAAAAVGRLADIAADVPLPCIRAQAALAQGRLAAHTDQAAAIAAFERGLTALTPGDWPLLRAALHLNLACALSGTDRAAAIAEAKAALAIFERVGAPEVEDASALLRGLGVAVRCGQSRPPGPLGRLSPREREVLDQLGLGLSNPEIADALTVSRKTIEHHVTSILNKLGLRSRAEAAVYAVTVAAT